MRGLKSIFGVITGIGGLLYCGFLIHYFGGIAGDAEGVKDTGLGPTLLGLTVVGALLAIPMMIKIIGLFTDLRGFGSGPSAPSDGGGIDADAVIARYMAQQAAGGDVGPPPASDDGAPRTSFGRKPR